MELQIIQEKIHILRGQKIILDFDLAELYETETRVLKQAVRRNIDRFPNDFMFELTKAEYESLRSQNVILKEKKGRGQHSKYSPFAFTEQGVAMLSSVLKSKKAIAININIMRAFVMIRRFALSYDELAQKIEALEEKYDLYLGDISEALNLLLEERENNIEWEKRKKIGFKK